MSLSKDASLALFFLILYSILFLILIFWYATKRIAFLSRYTTITLHVLVRLASQATGVAFGILGYKATDVLVAYFILGAEGYFTLVLCSYRFLISWHNHNLPSGSSWLEPKHPPGTPFSERFLSSFALTSLFQKKSEKEGQQTFSPMVWIHYLLIAANAIIISGGSLLSGGSKTAEDFGKGDNAQTGKVMRVIGQSIFLAINAVLLGCIWYSMKQSKGLVPLAEGRRLRDEAALDKDKKKVDTSKTTTTSPPYPIHPTLYLLLATWPFLFVRGVYGILASCYPPFSYFNPDNYAESGLKDSYVASEYVLGTTMEWVSCALLMATWWTGRFDKRGRDAVMRGDGVDDDEDGGNRRLKEARVEEGRT